MTTIIGWAALDSRAPASLYLASDSRISWTSGSTIESWDLGAKTFASPTTPDILGYCGDVVFPALVLPQFIATLGADLVGTPWQDRQLALKTLVERSLEAFPRPHRAPFTIFYGGRTAEGMESCFHAGRLVYTGSLPLRWEEISMPDRSSLIFSGGSGESHVLEERELWNESPTQGRTSRAEYSAFVDALLEGRDPHTGGAPQIVALYRIGNGRRLGTVYGDEGFVAGAPIDPQVDGNIQWHNELFELVDGVTRQLRPGAQRHRRPW